MHQGLLAKFNQNQYLAEVLLSTGEYTLVEANLHDSLWGIGLALGDPKVFSRQEWNGKNQLGDLLMAVRHELRMR